MKQIMLLSDTRIPPEGLVADMKTAVTDEIDFKDGLGGYHHWDELGFSLAAPDGVTGVATLSARVYFQSISREYVEFLKTWRTAFGLLPPTDRVVSMMTLSGVRSTSAAER